MVYGADPYNPGLMAESRVPLRRDKNPIGSQWSTLEALAEEHVGQQADTALTILRPAAVPVYGGTDYFRGSSVGGWYRRSPCTIRPSNC